MIIAIIAWAGGYALAHPDITPTLPNGALPLPATDEFQPERRVPVVAGAALLTILLFSSGLAGADPDLERATATRWWRWRATHLAGVLVVTAALLAIAVIPAPTTFGAAAMARNAAGYVGLTALSATLVGASLAWAPPLVFAATVYLAAPRQPTGAALWWAWPMQPGSWDASWICAMLICLLGAVIYIRYGSGPLPNIRTSLQRS